MSKTSDQRFWASTHPRYQCWEWKGAKNEKGYGIFNTGSGNVRAHRYSYEMHHGPISKGKLVCHSCDNPGCVNPDHLFCGTEAHNTADAVSKGRMAKGEASGTAKLSEANVVEMRRLKSIGVSRDHLAKQFGVHPQTVSKILKRMTWRHI